MKIYKMKYKKDKKGRYGNNLIILGTDFVKNNKNKAKLIIKNKKYYLKEYIQINHFENSEIKISILLNKDVCNLSYMFNNSKSLLEISIKNITENKEINYDFPEFEENYNEIEYNINKINQNKITFYEGLKDNILYCKCSEISKKEEFSEKTKNTYLEIYNLEINNRSKEIISENSSSLSLCDNKLYFNNIINMSHMFYNC